MNIYALEVFIVSGPVSEKFVQENPMISRTIEIRGDQTLGELHRVIFAAFDREDEHMYEFQFGGKGPSDPKAKVYGLACGSPSPSKKRFKKEGDASKTTMDELGLKAKNVFGYWFDFGDDWWHQVNVVSVEDKTPKCAYPRVTGRVGKSPPQYMDQDE